MKSVKFAFAALVLAGGIVAAFAFTAPEKKAAPVWFEFIGVTSDVNDVKDPQQYIPFTGTVADVDPDVNLYLVRVDDVTEVYAAGQTNAGKPKVDIVNSSLQLALLDATGHDATAKNDITNRVILIP